jgi:N-acetylmuramoyl-L-alanine amidase
MASTDYRRAFAAELTPPPRPIAAANTNVSRLAVGDGTLRRSATRTLPVHGLCVHTTGSGPATKARKAGTSPAQIALDYYVRGREGFPHYLIDYNGTIRAICDEAHVAWHAGWAQRGGKQRWTSWVPPTWWSGVWRPRNIRTPADLLPTSAVDPNSVYIGVELLGDPTGWGFTDLQYGALARLIVDVFRRHRIPLSQPPNPRLLGHEDLEPVDRANAQGGWDPGAHRTVPKFSWPKLWSRIQAPGAPTPATNAPPAPPPPAPPNTLPTSLFSVGEAALAFARGERDANRLADIVFHARHRERGGRPIQAAETQLAQEWLWIRANIVTPALQRLGTTPAPAFTPTTSFPASAFTRNVPAVRRWALLAPLLDRYRGEIPLEFLLGWIAVESNGRIDVVTSLDERGFFQIHPAESRDARPPLQHHRLSTDPDYSVQAGIQLVRHYAALARRRFPWIRAHSELFWRIVKLQHAMGSGLANTLMNQMRARGINPTWDAIKRYELTDGPRLHRLLAVKPGRFGRNVDHVFERGRAIARTLRR